MTHLVRIMLVTSALALPLGGCANIGDALDPGEWFSGDLFSSKKKLPGERKPVFPEGVPGVAQGIPPDLIKGNQPPAGSGLAGDESVSSTQRQAVAQPEEYQPAPREQAKAKPKPKPKPATAERQPASGTVRRPPDSQQQQQQQEQQAGNAVQWPDPPPPQRSGGQGAVQWPDPPPLR